MSSVISVLLPTRQRPKQLHRMVASIWETANRPDLIELVTYIDEDDPSYDGLEFEWAVKWTKIRGPRELDGLVNLSWMWNECLAAATGDIFMHCGDDIVFRTPGWDALVREEFDAVPDKIIFIFGRDGYQDGNNFGTHGFVHRKWIETVGYWFPPLFTSDYNDVFLNDVAKLIGRHKEIGIYTEHMHHCAGKAEIDQNTRERLERHHKYRPQDLYYSDEVQAMIREAADKLRAVMDAEA